MTRRIVSITPFHNETHILDLRIGILEDTVDHFYTIEANKTFTNRDKEMLAKTIVHPKHTVVEIEFPEHLTTWGRENYQRDVKVDLSAYNDDDIVLINDLDEIPNPKALEKLREIFDPDRLIWMDTIESGRFADTNSVFVAPTEWDLRIQEFDADRWALRFVKFVLTE